MWCGFLPSIASFCEHVRYFPEKGKLPDGVDLTGNTPGQGHMGNWIDCVRSRKTPNASAEIGFRSAIAVHMANLAYRHQKCHPDSEGVTLKTAPAIPSYCSLLLSDARSGG